MSEWTGSSGQAGDCRSRRRDTNLGQAGVCRHRSFKKFANKSSRSSGTMILKGSARGSAMSLAVHLLNTEDNDHVEVHSVTGFMCEDVTGAFKEVQAIAKGTKCTKPFFSVSLNPPSKETVSIEAFELAVEQIEDAHDLRNQPRVIIFHEKDGRRHAHVVWSRIDAERMTAKELPFFKNKLREVSKQLYVQNHWQMPRGLMDSEAKNPTNVTLAEWQAAKRLGKNAIDQKKLIQECWAVSDSRASFQAALEERGYILAKGYRRGHVIVAYDGEVLTVARATGLKAKIVRERLNEPDDLLSVREALEQHNLALKRQFKRFARELRLDLVTKRSKLNTKRADMIVYHRNQRAQLDKGQAARWEKEVRQRASRLKRGVAGVWQWVTGERNRIHHLNETEALQFLKRDRNQRQTLISAQLSDRRILELERTEIRQQSMGLIQELKSDRDRIVEKLSKPSNQKPLRPRKRVKQDFEQSIEIDFAPDS